MEILTAGEVADLMKVPKSSIYSYSAREVDPLPHFRIGRHVRFERAAGEAWIAEQMAIAAGTRPVVRA
jgi:excisionase family DNA binding protein